MELKGVLMFFTKKVPEFLKVCPTIFHNFPLTLQAFYFFLDYIQKLFEAKDT